MLRKDNLPSSKEQILMVSSEVLMNTVITIKEKVRKVHAAKRDVAEIQENEKKKDSEAFVSRNTESYLQCLTCRTFVVGESSQCHNRIHNCRQKTKSDILITDDEQMIPVRFPHAKIKLTRIVLQGADTSGELHGNVLIRENHTNSPLCNQLLSRVSRQSSIRARQKLRKICHEESTSERTTTVTASNKSTSVLDKRKTKRNSSPEVRNGNVKLPYKCTKCTVRFQWGRTLKNHMKKVHCNDELQKADVHKCPICGRMVFRRYLFQCHLLDHTEAEEVEEELDIWNKWPKSKMARFSCKYCLTLLHTHETFKRHMKSEHGGKSHRWECSHCRKITNKITLLVEHLKLMHPKAYYGEETDLKALSKGDRKWKCDDCGNFLGLDESRRHKLLGKCKTDRSVKIAENEFICPLKGCEMRMKSALLLKYHFIRHLKNNPYVCKVEGCGRRFDSHSHLKMHMRFHTGETRVTCPSCGISFARQQGLRRHYMKKVCKGSDVRVTKPWLRLKTVPKRTEEGNAKICINEIMKSDPVFIDVCRDNPGFKELMLGRQKISSKNYSGQVTPSSVKKLWRCFKCNLAFSIQKSLLKHQKLCNANGDFNVSNETNNLETNEEIMLGCRICGDYFNDKAKLNCHVNEHPPEKLFRCELCDEVFPNNVGKLRHALESHDADANANPATQSKRCKKNNICQDKRSNVYFNKLDGDSTTTTTSFVKVESELIIPDNSQEEATIPSFSLSEMVGVNDQIKVEQTELCYTNDNVDHVMSDKKLLHSFNVNKSL